MKNYYTVEGSLVKDHVDHWSYNCTNPKDAVKLCEKLNNQEKELRTLRRYEKNLKEVTEQLKQVVMSMNNLQADIEKLKQKFEKQG